MYQNVYHSEQHEQVLLVYDSPILFLCWTKTVYNLMEIVYIIHSYEN